jgi:aryl-alcohol dehydrogenase-like predicted oxidoreductase
VRRATLGLTGLDVSAIGLGCMGMSEWYGPADRDESLATLRRALDLGITLLDTADIYGLGANEQLIGEFIAGCLRADVVVATKFGPIRDPRTGKPVGLRGDAAYVRQACDASLRRLGTDYIDLYYQHFPDPRTPVEETVGAMGELVTAGKVRHLGLSNITATQLRAAAAVHPIVAVQSEWSLFSRDPEESLIPACAELGVSFVPYSPLGRGFLTGAYTSTAGLSPGDLRQVLPRFQGENAAHNVGLLRPVANIAAGHGATPAQVALAWLIQQQEIHGVSVVPIPGTKRRARLEENAAAASLQLTPGELVALEPIAAQVAGSGHAPRPPEVDRLVRGG